VLFNEQAIQKTELTLVIHTVIGHYKAIIKIIAEGAFWQSYLVSIQALALPDTV
jgi:hypothetical protein